MKTNGCMFKKKKKKKKKNPFLKYIWRRYAAANATPMEVNRELARCLYSAGDYYRFTYAMSDGNGMMGLSGNSLPRHSGRQCHNK